MDFQDIIEMLQEIQEDRVPKNVSKQVDDIIACLSNEETEDTTKIHKTLSILDDIANDVNVASHIRTMFWNITSILESNLS